MAIVFGNFDAVSEEAVRQFGPTVPLTTWWFDVSEGLVAASHSKGCARQFQTGVLFLISTAPH